MQWNRSNTIGLAKVSCALCKGHGMRVVYKVKQAPCGCVFREIFRICIRRFRQYALSETYTSTVTWEYYGAGGFRVLSRKKEEYMADLCLIAERTLTEYEHRLFRYYHLLGADWKLCTRRFNLDRGQFFHFIYRIEERLGCAFVETAPYALFPLEDYFGPQIRKGPSSTLIADPAAERRTLQVPLLLSA